MRSAREPFAICRFMTGGTISAHSAATTRRRHSAMGAKGTERSREPVRPVFALVVVVVVVAVVWPPWSPCRVCIKHDLHFAYGCVVECNAHVLRSGVGCKRQLFHVNRVIRTTAGVAHDTHTHTRQQHMRHDTHTQP